MKHECIEYVERCINRKKKLRLIFRNIAVSDDKIYRLPVFFAKVETFKKIEVCDFEMFLQKQQSRKSQSAATLHWLSRLHFSRNDESVLHILFHFRRYNRLIWIVICLQMVARIVKQFLQLFSEFEQCLFRILGCRFFPLCLDTKIHIK